MLSVVTEQMSLHAQGTYKQHLHSCLLGRTKTFAGLNVSLHQPRLLMPQVGFSAKMEEEMVCSGPAMRFTGQSR